MKKPASFDAGFLAWRRLWGAVYWPGMDQLPFMKAVKNPTIAQRGKREYRGRWPGTKVAL